MLPDRERDIPRRTRDRMQSGQERRQHAPREKESGEDRDADGQTDQVPRTQERERKREVEAGSGVACAEIFADVVREDAHIGEQRKDAGDDRAPDDRDEPQAVGFLALGSRTDDQDFCGRDALGVREIGVRHERAA